MLQTIASLKHNSFAVLLSSLLLSTATSLAWAETPFEKYSNAALQARKQRNDNELQRNLKLALQESKSVDLKSPSNQALYNNISESIPVVCTWYTQQDGMEGQCKQLYQLKLASDERAYGLNSPKLIKVLYKLGSESEDLNQLAESEKYYKRAADLAEKCSPAEVEELGLAIPGMFHGYQNMIRNQGRTQEADQIKNRFRKPMFTKIRKPGY
jgi:hypothetical protein